MASRGTIHGNVVINCLALLSPAGLQLWRRAQWNQRSRPQSREVSEMWPLGPGTSSSLPAVASESHPGSAAASAMTKASDGEMCDDVVCVAQRLVMEVRKAAATEGRNTSMPKAGKKKLSRRSHFKASSSDTSGDEVLRKRHRGQVSAHPVTLPLVHPSSPSLHSQAGDTGPPGTPRACASSAKLTDTETAWSQARKLRSLVEEKQNVIRQMQLATVDSAPCSAHGETVRDPIDAP